MDDRSAAVLDGSDGIVVAAGCAVLLSEAAAAVIDGWIPVAVMANADQQPVGSALTPSPQQPHHPLRLTTSVYSFTSNTTSRSPPPSTASNLSTLGFPSNSPAGAPGHRTKKYLNACSTWV